MELIDVKTKRIYGIEELRNRIIAEAKKRGARKPTVSIGRVNSELAETYGLAVIQKQQATARDGEKIIYSTPEQKRDGSYERRAIVKPLSKEERKKIDARKPADLSQVNDPIIKALARKMELTQGEVDRENS